VAPIDALSGFLDQLLGYVLFDVEDRYAIEAVAVYLAWQGVLLTAPLAEVFQLASGRASFDLAGARRDFRAVIGPTVEMAHFYKHGTTS